MFAQKAFQLKSYLQYLLRAKTKYYIHSAFVYELTEEVIYDQRRYYAFDDIAGVRGLLMESDKHILTCDYGAGTALGKGSATRRVRDIARTAAVPPSVGELLFRLVHHFQPQYVLELGTSLGLGTMYMAMAARTAQVTTIEGCTATAGFAAQLFDKMRLTNIAPHIGNFDDVLPKVLNALPQVDMVFFDGNHRYEPTLRYFEWCLPKISPDTVFIFDDIYWSSDMARAWQHIQAHPAVSVTIDLYRAGIAFFRTGQAKENFTLYFG